MEELEMCPKIVFGSFLVTFGIEGGDLAKKGVKESRSAFCNHRKGAG